MWFDRTIQASGHRTAKTILWFAAFLILLFVASARFPLRYADPSHRESSMSTYVTSLPCRE